MQLRRIWTSSWPPIVVTALALALLMFHVGVPATALVKLAAYLLFTVMLPGLFAWRLLLRSLHTGRRAPPTWFEDVTLGTIFGFGIQLPVYLVGVWFHRPLLYWFLPVMVAAVTVMSAGGRTVWRLPTAHLDYRVAWGMGATILYGVVWLWRNVFPLQPLGRPRNVTPFVDESFHQSLIGELMYHVPPSVPFLHDTSLDYHWFVHAQIAAMVWGTHIDTRVLLRVVMPCLMVALTVLGLGAVALRLTRRPFTAWLAPAILVAGGFNLIGPHFDAWKFAEPYMMNRLVYSPTQAYGFTMALPAIFLTLEVLRQRRRTPFLLWVALAISLFALSGAKATFMPIFLCAAIAVWLFQLVVNRTFDKTAGALVVLAAIVTAFAQVVLFGGQGGALNVTVLGTVRDALAAERIANTAASMTFMTTTLLIGWLLYGVGAFGLIRGGRWRDRRAIWMLAGIPVGIAVGLVFARPGWSQLWFQRSVAELVVLLSVWGLAEMLPNPLPRRQAVRLAGVAAAAGLGAFVVSSVLESRRDDVHVASYHTLVYTTLAPIIIVAAYAGLRQVVKARRRISVGPELLVVFLLGLGLTHVYSVAADLVSGRPVPQTEPVKLFAAGGVPAASWLALHSSPYTTVATNAHCRHPHGPCDNRNFWISGYTRRRILIEGWGYSAVTNDDRLQGESGSQVPVPDPRLLAVNDAAFTHPSAATIGRLARTYGVRWLFVDKAYPVDLARLDALRGTVVERAYHNRMYAVFKVKPPPVAP